MADVAAKEEKVEERGGGDADKMVTSEPAQEPANETEAEKDETEKAEVSTDSSSPVKEVPVVKATPTKGDGEKKGKRSVGWEYNVDAGPGLFEQPVVVEGKRERKKTDRLTAKAFEPEPKKKKEVVFVDGGGTPLGSIPYIVHMLNKVKADDMNILHRVLFDANAPASKVKHNIRKFNGFDFDKDSKEFEKRDELLNRAYWTVIQQQFLKILGVDKVTKGEKAETVKAIMEFLLKPHDHGKALPGQKKKKAKAKKRKRSASDKKEPSKKKAKKEKGEGDAAAAGDDSSDDDSSSDEEEEEQMQRDSGAELGSGESGDEKSTPKAKSPKKKEKKDKKETPKKKEPAKKKATPKKKEPGSAKKKAAPKKKKEGAPKKKSTPKKDAVELSTDTTMSDSDDEPLSKKSKSPPNDAQLKDTIKKILEGANLEQVTMKTVCQAVYSKFPDFDLTNRKDFIKGTVKDLIN